MVIRFAESTPPQGDRKESIFQALYYLMKNTNNWTALAHWVGVAFFTVSCLWLASTFTLIISSFVSFSPQILPVTLSLLPLTAQWSFSSSLLSSIHHEDGQSSCDFHSRFYPSWEVNKVLRVYIFPLIHSLKSAFPKPLSISNKTTSKP